MRRHVEKLGVASNMEDMEDSADHLLAFDVALEGLCLGKAPMLQAHAFSCTTRMSIHVHEEEAAVTTEVAIEV